MRYLLDTHLLVWASGYGPGRERLSEKVAAELNDERNLLLFSPISILEIAIKSRRGRPDLPSSAELFRSRLMRARYDELPLRARDAAMTADLPDIHRDPFDRLLIAQAMANEATLLTADATIARYPGPIRKV